MSDVLQMTPAVSKPPVSPNANAVNPTSAESSSEFNSVLKNYVEGESENLETIDAAAIDQNLPLEMLVAGNMLPMQEQPTPLQAEKLMQQASASSLMLPQTDKINLLQAENKTNLFQAENEMNILQPESKVNLLQPADKTSLLQPTTTANLLQPTTTANLSAEQIHAINLLEQQGSSKLNPQLSDINTPKNITDVQGTSTTQTTRMAVEQTPTQLAAINITPDSSEVLFVSMNEQVLPLAGSGLNINMTQNLTAAGLASTTQSSVPLSLGQPAWESNFSNRLQMMIGQNVQTAEIRLDPPELGSLDIKIKVSNDVATINIVSANGQVRDALESSIPRLREMFEESGISLGDVNVQQESFTQQENLSDDESVVAGESLNSDYVDDDNHKMKKVESNGLLDLYA